MPLVEITPPPGFRNHGTDLESEGRWRDGSLVRWHEGSLRPVGGWAARVSSAPYAAAPRGMVAWQDNILNRWIEDGLTDVLEEEGIGCIPFCPLAQGLLTNRYLERIPKDSRAAKSHGFLQTSEVERQQVRIQALAAVAAGRGVSLAQLALQWVLRKPVVTSALIGASSVKQIEENLSALGGEALTSDELAAIDAACAL